MQSEFEILKDHLAKEGFPLASFEPDFEGLNAYLKLLSKWNKVHDLVTKGSEQSYVDTHFVDAAAAVIALQSALDSNEKYRLIDIGTGAGFPGVVWRLCTHIFSEVCLVEPRSKRVAFLKQLQQELSLEHVHTYEDSYSSELAKRMAFTNGPSIAVLRALKPSQEMIEAFFECSATGSKIVWMSAREEHYGGIEESRYFEQKISYSLPKGDQRVLLISETR